VRRPADVLQLERAPSPGISLLTWLDCESPGSACRRLRRRSTGRRKYLVLRHDRALRPCPRRAHNGGDETFSGQCRELDISDLFGASNVGGVEFTAAPTQRLDNTPA